jgi:hypothetical protein
MAFNALTAATWALNIAKAVGLTLSTLGMGAIVVAAAGAAAAATYALASQYGAKTEAPPNIGAAAPTVAGTTGGAATAAEAEAALGWELPTVTPGAGMTGKEMAVAGLGQYIKESGVFIPKEESLIHDDIAFKVSAGANAGKYKWIREGPAEGTYMTMDILESWRRGEGNATVQKWLRPWFTFGFEERTDDLGNVWLQGKHFQKGGLILGDTLGMIHRDEAVLPLTDTGAMDRIAAAIGGGGGTVIQNFYINGAKDVDLIMNEIAQKMRYRGVGH